jgi:hypothetical protein
MKPLIICITFLFLISSCGQQKKYFYLPNGETIQQETVEKMTNSYAIKYEQYEGFASNYKDSLMKKFILVIENQNDAIV